MAYDFTGNIAKCPGVSTTEYLKPLNVSRACMILASRAHQALRIQNRVGAARNGHSTIDNLYGMSDNTLDYVP
jgi:hypothetical protein